MVSQRVAGNTSIIGCMIESNIKPGRQPLNGDPSKLAYGVSVTDSCIGWEETQDLLTWTYDKVAVTSTQ